LFPSVVSFCVREEKVEVDQTIVLRTLNRRREGGMMKNKSGGDAAEVTNRKAKINVESSHQLLEE